MTTNPGVIQRLEERRAALVARIAKLTDELAEVDADLVERRAARDGIEP